MSELLMVDLEGERHRRQRKMVTPVFSPALLREMGTNIFAFGESC